MLDYEERYKNIIKTSPSRIYKSAEEEASRIKKLNLLKDSNVSYDENYYSSDENLSCFNKKFC